jgi:hypothetical protein
MRFLAGKSPFLQIDGAPNGRASEGVRLLWRITIVVQVTHQLFATILRRECNRTNGLYNDVLQANLPNFPNSFFLALSVLYLL